MMQVPSSNSNHSDFTSRRSNANRRGGNGGGIRGWLDGIIDKTCCVSPGYNVGDEVLDDDETNSIVNNNNNNEDRDENSFLRASKSCFGSQSASITHQIIREDDSIIWEEPEESIHWQTPSLTKGIPMSPAGSDTTATTVLTGSSNSSRSSFLQGRDDSSRRGFSGAGDRHQQHVRSHSTGNIPVSPEDEWLQQQQQQQAEDRRIKQSSSRQTKSSSSRSKNKSKKKDYAPRQVMIPKNWTHEHGLRRMQSDTYRLPFQTVQQPEQQVYYRSNN